MLRVVAGGFLLKIRLAADLVKVQVVTMVVVHNIHISAMKL